MDGATGYTTNLGFLSKDLGKVVDYPVASTLDFNSPNVFSSHFSKRSNGKCSPADQPINLKDGSSLVLGLGHSSSSCTAIFLEKEMEEGSSIDLGLSIDLNIGDNSPSNAKKAFAGTSNALKMRMPILDLQLSLSTGPSESEISTVSQGFFVDQNNSGLPALAPTIQLVDEGSTSSRWKAGPLIPPFQTQEVSIPFGRDHGCGNPHPLTPNFSSTAVATPSLADSSCDIVNQQSSRKTNMKTCMFKGCTTGARGASGLCIAHGGGRRCQRAGCQKGAEGKTVFCKAHGGGRRCQHLGCTKSAEGRTDYCIGHGGGRRCSHEGCTRAARGKSGLCIRHGGGKRCKMENCTRSAEGIYGLCISHGGGRRCQIPECSKGAQGSTLFCKAHGGGRRCIFLGCKKGAEGSTALCKGHGGGKRCTFNGCPKSVHGGTLFCVSHGGGKRCTMPGCTKSARGRTSYCVRHGGGKRCKFDGCTKSAQGSTDFCKAHGGGKRCSWGQLDSEFGGHGAIPCDKFARGKSGLCATHATQLHDLQSSPSTQMKGIFAAANNLPCHGDTNNFGTMSIGSTSNGHQLMSMPIMPQENIVSGNACFDNLSLPEGRVHGGSLMSMLRGGMIIGTNNNQEGSGQLEPHSWV